MTSPTEAPRTAAETLMALHVRRTTSSMEPDPERPGYARQTAWCEWCVNHADDDPRWPCLTVRALAEAAAPASPDVVERLAAIEHEQWEQWSRTIAEQGLTPDRIERWRRFWVPYDELDDETKEHDRVWARKALAALPAAAPAPPDVERQAAYVVSGLPVALRLDFIREVARQIGYTVVAATPAAKPDYSHRRHTHPDDVSCADAGEAGHPPLIAAKPEAGAGLIRLAQDVIDYSNDPRLVQQARLTLADTASPPAGLDALRWLFEVVQRLDKQAQEPGPDHLVKITVETWRSTVAPAIRQVERALAETASPRSDAGSEK